MLEVVFMLARRRTRLSRVRDLGVVGVTGGHASFAVPVPPKGSSQSRRIEENHAEIWAVVGRAGATAHPDSPGPSRKSAELIANKTSYLTLEICP